MPAPYNPLAAGQTETCSYPCGNPEHDHSEPPNIAEYRAKIRRVFQSMSMNALHFQNARIPWVDCVDRQEIDREYDRRATASGTGNQLAPGGKP